MSDTGRLKTSRPALQNIPIRLELVKPRVSKPDDFLIKVDYSKIELRVAELLKERQS